MFQSSGDEHFKLTQGLRCIGICDVDASWAEVAVRLQDENERSPPEHGSGETKTFYQTRSKGEAASHRHTVTLNCHGLSPAWTRTDVLRHCACERKWKQMARNVIMIPVAQACAAPLNRLS